MKTIVLSAGLSNRLKPVSDKSLLSLAGKPLLIHRLESLAVEGFSDFLIVVGKHNKEVIAKLLSETKLSYRLIEQKNLAEGMAGALKAVAEDSETDLSEPILIVSNNDTVDQSLLRKLAVAIVAPKNLSADGVIVGKEVEQYFPGGYIEHSKSLELTNIIEKPAVGEEPSNMINLVYHYYRNPRELFARLTKIPKESDGFYEATLLGLVKEGQKFKVLPYKGRWIPIKFPYHIFESAEYYCQKVKQHGIHPTAKIDKTAQIKGEVVIAEGVTIDANVVIVGPAYIGRNCFVGVNCFIRQSYIEENCLIGFSTEIARSYVQANCSFHHNYIGDSIIGENCSFGSGATTANFRLDGNPVVDQQLKLGVVTGNNVKVGVNATTLPGAKIGENSLIAPNAVIKGEIPKDSFVKNKQNLEIVANKDLL